MSEPLGRRETLNCACGLIIAEYFLLLLEQIDDGLLTLVPLKSLRMVTIERRAGVVHSVRPGEVVVRIQQQSACSGCHAKEFCCSTDCADRDVVVQTHDSTYRPGDHVFVEGRDSIGRLAVLLSFVIPIILFVLVLALSLRVLGWGELLALGLSFVALGLYYMCLRLLDPRLGCIMRFEITKAE